MLANAYPTLNIKIFNHHLIILIKYSKPYSINTVLPSSKETQYYNPVNYCRYFKIVQASDLPLCPQYLQKLMPGVVYIQVLLAAESV